MRDGERRAAAASFGDDFPRPVLTGVFLPVNRGFVNFVDLRPRFDSGEFGFLRVGVVVRRKALSGHFVDFSGKGGIDVCGKVVEFFSVDETGIRDGSCGHGSVLARYFRSPVHREFVFFYFRFLGNVTAEVSAYVFGLFRAFSAFPWQGIGREVMVTRGFYSGIRKPQNGKGSLAAPGSGYFFFRSQASARISISFGYVRILLEYLGLSIH